MTPLAELGTVERGRQSGGTDNDGAFRPMTDVSVPVLPLRVGGEPCAVPALAVLEVVGNRRFVAVPGAPAHLPGVVAWRGRAVAVVDLAVLLGKPPQVLASNTERTVMVKMSAGVVALPAQEVEGVSPIDPGGVRPARITRHRFAATEVELGERVLPLLDLNLIAEAILGPGGGKSERA